jgi:hypothetical protein
MTFKNICTKKIYQKDGKEKAKWYVVGTLKTMDDGKQFIELNLFPNTPFYVFEQKDRDAAPKKSAPGDSEESINLDGE